VDDPLVESNPDVFRAGTYPAGRTTTGSIATTAASEPGKDDEVKKARHPSPEPAGLASLTLRTYSVKVEVLGSCDQHILYVPGPMARAIVAGCSADVAHQNGRVKSIRLIATASMRATMIGPPYGR
jgi:hypothetical protein